MSLVGSSNDVARTMLSPPGSGPCMGMTADELDPKSAVRGSALGCQMRLLPLDYFRTDSHMGNAVQVNGTR
jgi:hypothetical protein